MFVSDIAIFVLKRDVKLQLTSLMCLRHEMFENVLATCIGSRMVTEY